MLPQELIHRLEEGGGVKWFRTALAVLVLITLAFGYNWRAFRNMNTPEAMDTAQLARNISEGRGYSTWCIRPFSMYLMKRHYEEEHTPQQLGVVPDSVRLKGNHPDLANPPAYPLFLAGIMKVLPFRYEMPSKPEPFWTDGGRFSRYQPDFLIAVVNELLLLGVAVMAFLIARKLFDLSVAWLSAILVFGTEMLWRFSVSGLSTMFLLLILMGLVYCLIHLEQQAREPAWPFYKVALLAAAIGLLAGLGALTRYSFAWMIIPLLAFIGLFGGQRRAWLVSVVAVVFLIMCAPWVIRNFEVSGTPFGTAGYAIYENTPSFPEYTLQRSLNPDLNKPLGIFWGKLMSGARLLVTSDLPKLGGTWLTSFFLVGLLIGFRNPAARRLRYFVVGSLVVLACAQIIGKTQLTEEGNGITNENLLVLLTPIMIIYGVSLFYLLLEQIQFPLLELRYAAIGAFGVVVCLPMILTFLPPKTIPISFPPYYPPALQNIGNQVKSDGLAMSDIPWATAWYGRTPSLWYTTNIRPDLLAINDYMRPISALYLSPAILDSKLLSKLQNSEEKDWVVVILETMEKRQVPTGFPLRQVPAGWLPNHIFLTSGKPDDIVARGKGITITRAQLNQGLSVVALTTSARGQTLTREQLERAEPQFLQNLVLMNLLLSRATDQDKETAKAAAAERVAMWKKRFGSEESLDTQLKQAGLTLAQLETQLGNDIVADAVLARELKPEVDDAEARKVYDENPLRFDQPEMVRVSHILLTTKDETGKDLPPEKKEAKRKEIEDLLVKARAGEDFAALARKYSEDRGSKDSGGELVILHGQTVPEFEKAAFDLKTNEVSNVVTTRFGYHIIKLSERIPARKFPYEEVASKIREQLKSQKIKQGAGEYAQALRKEAEVQILFENLATPAATDASATATPKPAAQAKPEDSRK